MYFVTLYEIVGAFFFGGVICQTATDILKYSLGRLRPNFVAICKPDWSKLECTDEHGFYRYVEDIVCNETDTEHLQEARWDACFVVVVVVCWSQHILHDTITWVKCGDAQATFVYLQVVTPLRPCLLFFLLHGLCGGEQLMKDSLICINMLIK